MWRLVLFGLVFWGLVVLGVAGSWVRERVCFWVRVLVRLVECPAEGSSRLVGLFGGVCRKFENSTACLGQCQWPNVHHRLVVGVWFIFLMHTTFQVCVSSLTNFVGFLLRCNNLF